MKKKWKQALVAVLLTMLLYLVIPMLSAFLAVKEWADTEQLLLPMMLAAAVSAVAGSLFLVRKGKWSVFAAALVTGVGVPILHMLAGYLVLGAVSMDGQRWLLPLTGFLSAMLVGLFLGQRKGKTRKGKRKHRG